MDLQGMTESAKGMLRDSLNAALEPEVPHTGPSAFVSKVVSVDFS